MNIFDTRTELGAYFITFTSSLDEKSVDAIRVATKSWLASPSEIFVLEMSRVETIHRNLFSTFVLFARDLKSNKKLLFSLSVSPALFKFLKDNGLDDLFNPVDDIKKIYQTADKKPMQKTKIDVEFIKPFITATQQTFGVQANTTITAEKPFSKTKASPDIAIAGVINITSKSFKGTIALCFPKDVFLAIYKNMLGEDHTDINAEIQDACGELLNILFGVAKAELNNKNGYEIEKALPTVLAGEKIKVQQTTALPVIVMPFKTPAGHFYLEIVAEDR